MVINTTTKVSGVYTQHKKLCKATAVVVKVPVETDLRAKIENLESILIEMASPSAARTPFLIYLNSLRIDT